MWTTPSKCRWFVASTDWTGEKTFEYSRWYLNFQLNAITYGYFFNLSSLYKLLFKLKVRKIWALPNYSSIENSKYFSCVVRTHSKSNFFCNIHEIIVTYNFSTSVIRLLANLKNCTVYETSFKSSCNKNEIFLRLLSLFEK